MHEEGLAATVRDYLISRQGLIVELRDIRSFLKIETGSQDDANLRRLMVYLRQTRVVSTLGRKDGRYKVVKQVRPVKVFGRERRPPIEIYFPRDFETMVEMPFAEDIVIRGGDLILISGQSNFGKTALILNFCAENLDLHPILMGNEYTTLDDEASQRFLNRLDNMDWVEWYDGNGEERFTLLPVREDYAEHIVKDAFNLIDWINLPGEYYLISPIMEGIKRELGSMGVGAIALQKNPGALAGRGGSMTRDFADCEFLIDQLDRDEVLLTVGKVKESRHPVVGRQFAYGIKQGVKIVNLREVVKCPACHGKKWVGTKPCEKCYQRGVVDK